MSKTLIIGDLHAGKKRNCPIFHRTLLEYGEWVKSQAHKYHVSHIVQMGDVFDNRTQISLSTLDCVTKFFDILEEFNIDITLGNHDCMYNDNTTVHSLMPFKKHKNITLHEGVTDREGVVFAGWGVKLEDIPPCKIFFGHIDTVGFELQRNKIATHGFKATDLMDKVSGTVFSGHYHLPQIRTYEGKPFCYTGSAFSLDWNDADSDKYIYILDTDTLEVEKVVNDISPRFHYINNETDILLIRGNYVSITYTIGEQGEAWKRLVQSHEPLELKINAIREKVQQVDNTIEKFQVIDIGQTISAWPIKNLNNLTEELKKRVAMKAKSMYDVVS